MKKQPYWLVGSYFDRGLIAIGDCYFIAGVIIDITSSGNLSVCADRTTPYRGFSVHCSMQMLTTSQTTDQETDLRCAIAVLTSESDWLFTRKSLFNAKKNARDDVKHPKGFVSTFSHKSRAISYTDQGAQHPFLGMKTVFYCHTFTLSLSSFPVKRAD